MICLLELIPFYYEYLIVHSIALKVLYLYEIVIEEWVIHGMDRQRI